MQLDYLIVGQGLCGTWLSYYLQKAGAAVLVIDAGFARSASAAASGIMNPITGKRLARQWMADTMLPFASGAYGEMGRALNMPLAAELPIHTFFSTAEEAAFFEQKAEGAHEDLLSYNPRMAEEEHFNYHYGTGSIYPALLVDVPRLLQGWRAILSAKSALLEERFDWGQCAMQPGGVVYKNLHAKAVIDCSGAASAANPMFSRLPFAPNKGEAIVASIPGLPRNAIYKYDRLSIVPWRDDHFWIGSTFDWDFQDELPTAAFRQKAESTLRNWLRLPYELHEHFAAVRPATVTRDAFAGMHPQYRQAGILNGMGSKGCSLAPFLAHNLAEHLINGTALIPQTDLSRYARTLSR